MTTQVSFTTDMDLKEKTLEKAKREGITLKALLVYAMKGFIDGKISLGLVIPNENEPDVEEIFFDDKQINLKAAKLAKLLK
ncbi:MAG: hypothetical protein AAB373_00830 [Patescibacteria group bacterium]